MALRETMDGLVANFIHDLLALVVTVPVAELAELERRPSPPSHALRPHTGTADDAARARLAASTEQTSSPRKPPPAAREPVPLEQHAEATPAYPVPPFSRESRIVVPTERLRTSLDELLLSLRLENVLTRERYVVLGDLNGRTFAELGVHRGMGRGCQRELHHALAELGAVVTPPNLQASRSSAADVVREAGRPRIKRTRMPEKGDTSRMSATSAETRDGAIAGTDLTVSHASDAEAGTANGRKLQDGGAAQDPGREMASTLRGHTSRSVESVPSDEANAADSAGRTTERTRTHEQRAADDAALLASGERLGLLAEIAPLLGVSVKMLRWAAERKDAPLVRYVSSSRPVRYCIADLQAAVEVARPDIDARRRRAEEVTVEERAQAEASRAAKALAPKEQTPAITRAAPRALRSAPPSSDQSGPDVLVIRRAGYVPAAKGRRVGHEAP